MYHPQTPCPPSALLPLAKLDLEGEVAREVHRPSEGDLEALHVLFAEDVVGAVAFFILHVGEPA